MRVVAYQPDIPQNLGALARLCACFDAPLDVIEPCGFPFSAKALRRAAMDYAQHVALTRWDSWSAFLRDRPPGRLILLTTAAETPLWRCRFAPDDLLMLGRESAGAPEEAHQAADLRLKIPLKPGLRSLNVVTAAAIALGEADRQRRAAAEEGERDENECESGDGDAPLSGD